MQRPWPAGRRGAPGHFAFAARTSSVQYHRAMRRTLWGHLPLHRCSFGPYVSLVPNGSSIRRRATENKMNHTCDESPKPGRRRARRVLASVLVPLGMALGLAGMATAASAAGPVYVYVSLPTWLGNCPGGGTVRYLDVTTWSSSATDHKADYGDDLVYIKAAYRDDTTVVSKPLCYQGSKTYWGPESYRTISATRQGQTWWIGPGGVRNN